MRDPVVELKALYDNCQMARADLRSSAARFLAMLGWAHPLSFSPSEKVEEMGAVPFLLRAQSGESLAALFLPAGTLEDPSAYCARGLDYCRTTRILVEEMKSLNAGYLLISDLRNSYLYDLENDVLLLWASGAGDFQREFASSLVAPAMDQGSLGELRRPPRSAQARQLREWRQHWVGRLVAQGACPEASADLLVDRLLTVRFLFAHKIFRRTRVQLEGRFDELVQAAWRNQLGNPGEKLANLFHDMWFDWQIDLFRPDPDLEAALTSSPLVSEFIVDSMLLSQPKIGVATILESFNFGEPEEKLRVRMVPDSNEDREHYLAIQSLNSIDDARIMVDLQEEGYRAIFFWLDKVVSLYEKFSSDFDEQHPLDEENAAEGMELFAWSTVDAERPDACGDSLSHACNHGFGVFCASSTQYRIGRLLLTLHLIERYHQRRQMVERFPSFEPMFEERPEVLHADQVLFKRGGRAPRRPSA
jgi:hypothetical protein